MRKLVLQELWSDLFYNKMKKSYNYIIVIIAIVLWIALLGSAFMYGNILNLAVFIVLLSNYMLKSNISDCIYIIPCSVREYVKVRYRLTMFIELACCAVVEAIIAIMYILSDEGMSYSLVLEQLFIMTAFILYVLIKNTWLLYVNFGLKEMQTYKCAQGLSFFWFYCIGMIVDVADERITNTVPLILVLLGILGFAAYAVYICLYVKKNLIIRTFK